MPLIPFARIKMLGKPEKKVPRVKKGSDALQEGPAADDWWHASVMECSGGG